MMKTKETSEKNLVVVYRKDGKTPDRRYKSSREAGSTQNPQKDKKPPKEEKTRDFNYQRFRDNVTSKKSEKINTDAVQIKPVGKKPLWKVGS